MLVSSAVHCIAVLIFQLLGVQTLSIIPACPASCICEKTLLINCASLGLSKAPSHIPATATTLDLSHNALHSLAPLGSGRLHLQGLQRLWVGNNSLKSLSMCSGIQGIVGTKTLTRRKQRCVSWAPDLQLLSADRNQLKSLPRGLGNIKSLKVLQLSHNRISEIGPADLAGCTHLSDLNLQHNLIDTIHPEAFKDLQKLRVLDVSFNLLATITAPAYLSLRNLNVLVDISGNRWRCDCNLKTIRRWLSFDSELGNPAWEVECVSPPHHAGKDLLDLEESDLACPQPVYNTPGVKKELTVDEGMEFILYCSAEDRDFIHTRWWTPHGQRIYDSQQFLHISNTTERDAGLYVCISGYQEEHVSVFNLHVRKRGHDRRLRREAQIGSADLNGEDNDRIQRNVPNVRAVEQSQFALAVSLSVFITFIVAFVLGVILRPLLEKCYRQVRNKRNSTTSPSNSQTSSTGQRPYVNEGYSDTDDQEQEVHEGPRVTFGGVTEIQERAGVPYYLTVDDSPSGSNTDVEVLYRNAGEKESLTENTEVHREVPLREENREMTSPRSAETLNAESSKGMQFEYIPDTGDTAELEDRSISPASSLSGEQQEPQIFYEAKESSEQSVDSPSVSVYEDDDEQASTDHQATIPGFITDPFPLVMSESKEECVDELDPDLWNDSGESFSFTEGSPRSSSRVSHIDALGYPLNQKEMSVDEQSDRPSSCNSNESGESEGDPTEYPVNPEDDEYDINYSKNRPSPSEEADLTEGQQTGTGARFRQDTITLDPTDIHMTYTRGDSLDDEPFTEYKECFSSSNSDYEDEPAQYNVHPVYRTSQKPTDLTGGDRLRTSSCSEEEEDIQGDNPRTLEIRFEDKVPSIDATPVVSPDRLLNINYDNHSSITDTEDKHSKEKERGLSLSGSETNKKAVQPEPNTATTNSKSTGGFLGSFKKQPSGNVSMTTNDDNFFVTIGQAFNGLPKLKNSLLFSISVPKPPHQQESTSVIDRISESEWPHVSSSYDDSIFGKIDQTLDPIPRVKRYLHFSQKRPCFPIQVPPRSTEEIIPNKVVKTESKKCTSEDDGIATTKGDNFFGQIGASVDDLPKVKRYVQFSPSESKLSNHSARSASANQVARIVEVSKTDSPSDTINIFYNGQSISLPAQPKLQRYVQFTQLEPQTVHTLPPTITGDSFFGQIPISFDEVPRVKQYVQFSPSESKLSNHSSHSASVNQVARPIVVSKTVSTSDTINIFYNGQSISLPAQPKLQRYVQFTQLEPQTVHTLPPTITGDSFFLQIPISFDEVPKVKRYVQFSPSESQLSNHSARSASVNQVARPVEVSKTESPSDTINIFYKGQSISLPALPKVQRYVQFTQLEPQTVYPLPPTITGDSFFGQIPISFDEVPKVKRYVQFSPSESQLSNHSARSASVNQVARPIVVSKTESPSDTINIFYKGQSISLPAQPKVQRYVQFTQLEPQTVHPLPPTITGDSFFGQIPISVDEVPRVKQYVQFSPSESQLSNHSAHSAPVNQVARPVEVSKKEFPSDTINIFFEGQSISLPAQPKVQRYVQFTQLGPQSVHPLPPTITGDSFFGQIPISFDEVPRVKQYVQFSPSESQLSNHSAHSAPVNQLARPVEVTKTESPSDTINIFFKGQSISLPAQPKVGRYVQFIQLGPQTVHTLPPNITGDSFFGQIPISFDEVPKVKRYILFSQSHQKPSKKKYSLSDEQITPEIKPSLVTKAYAKPLKVGDNFFGQIALDGVPKVKKYIQFTQSESQPSAQSHSLPVVTEIVTPVLLTEMQSTRSEDKVSPTIKDDDFFGHTGSSFDGLPKVKRYIQFTQAEPRIQLHSSTNKTQKTMKDLASEDYIQPTAGEHSFFGPIGASFEIPKVKRYIQFSQGSTQPSSPTLHKQKATAVLKSNNEDTFFKDMNASVSELPKLKRYIQFTQKHSTPPKSSNTNGITDDGAKKREIWGAELSMVDMKPPVTEDNFFGQLGTNLHSLPTVNRYIQFTQAEPYPSSQVQSPTEKMTKKEWKTLSSSIDDAKSSTKYTFFDGIIPLDNIPKVKKALLFTPSKYQNQTEVPQKVTPQLVKNTKSVSSSSLSDKDVLPKKQDNFFGQVGVFLDEVPKVKRYIKFSQSEAYPSSRSSVNIKGGQSPSPIFKTDIVTPEMARKTESSSTVSSFEKNRSTDTFLGRTDISFDEVPKVKRYIQFIKSEPQPSAQSPSSSPVITEFVTPEFSTKMQSTRSEDKVVPTNKGNDFFDQTGSSFDGLPKVKRYVQFTQAEPRLQPPLLHTLRPTSKTEKTTMRDLASEDYIQPAAVEHNYFGPIGASSEIPKVKRYIQFSQRSTQPSSPSLHRQNATPVLTKPELERSSSSSVDSKSSHEDTLFKKLDASVSELPKVKRYIRFTQHSSPPESSNTHGVTVVAKKRELWGSDLSTVDVKPPVAERNVLGHLGTNLNSQPRVNRYIQFTQAEPYPSRQSQSPTEKMTKTEWKTLSASKLSTKDTFLDGVHASEYQNRTAANDKSSNAADDLFGSLNVSFNQLPKVKRHVQIVQSENDLSPMPSKFVSHSYLENKQSFPSENEFKFTTKEMDSSGQTDGVPRLIRYTQFRQSEPHSQTLSPSVSSQKWEKMDVGTESRMFKTNVTPVFTETSKLNQFPEPKRSLFSSKSGAYELPDQVLNQAEEIYRQTSSNSSSGDKKHANSQGPSRRTALSSTESEIKLEPKLSSWGASSNESESNEGSEKDGARAYLRDSSLARQRHERRRMLFQQKRRAMDGFSLTSESFTSQESDQ